MILTLIIYLLTVIGRHLITRGKIISMVHFSRRSYHALAQRWLLFLLFKYSKTALYLMDGLGILALAEFLVSRRLLLCFSFLLCDHFTLSDQVLNLLTHILYHLILLGGVPIPLLNRHHLLLLSLLWLKSLNIPIYVNYTKNTYSSISSAVCLKTSWTSLLYDKVSTNSSFWSL